ncbi:cation diffusion facilitator family transporter [Wenzhouxiangella sediminis]|uniref:Cation transporter n=1 Tax=Wenzhouxiangella sediminis TaxID=1792836 RepID=A0A3E1K7W1_9GAMM|nr:cation diffusion facilitator family transporter [Wenzhouxiangella sediminis]RFF30148.1 cation transporter [Wenzhouxiangella sediminis]
MAAAFRSNANLDQYWPDKRRVTIVGAVWNLLLAIGKIAAGIVGHSQALIVDGIHSLSDMVSDAVVLVAARWSAIEADHNHPYGHGRIETVATAIVGVLLLAVAIGFIVDAVLRLLDPERLMQPGWLALWAAAASVGIKEILFWYTRRVARHSRSNLIMANAWHHRSDALSSIVVIAGVIGAMGGFLWLDAVAAILVAGTVAVMGGRFAFDSLVELVDTAVPPREQKQLAKIILSVDGVQDFRDLRTRLMGGQIFMDVCILLDPQLTLDEANRVAAMVRTRLLSESTEVFDAVVSVAPLRAPRMRRTA